MTPRNVNSSTTACIKHTCMNIDTSCQPDFWVSGRNAKHWDSQSLNQHKIFGYQSEKDCDWDWDMHVRSKKFDLSDTLL